MSESFTPCRHAWWPSIAAGLSGEWSREAAMMDLRWHADEARVFGRPFPSRPALSARWGWTDKRVRLLLASPEWADPFNPTTLADLRGETKGRRGAGQGPTKGRTGADGERLEADTSPERAGQGPTRGRTGADEGPHARVLHQHQPPTPDTMEDSAPASGAAPIPTGGLFDGLRKTDPSPAIEPPPKIEPAPSTQPRKPRKRVETEKQVAAPLQVKAPTLKALIIDEWHKSYLAKFGTKYKIEAVDAKRLHSLDHDRTEADLPELRAAFDTFFAKPFDTFPKGHTAMGFCTDPGQWIAASKRAAAGIVPTRNGRPVAPSYADTLRELEEMERAAAIRNGAIDADYEVLQ